MARFELRLTAPIPPEQAWARVWNLDAHSRVIPLTRLRGDGTAGEPLRPGARFVARTGVGPLAVDDVMEATTFESPAEHGTGRAVVEKRGRVVHGRIDAHIRATATGSELTWTQEIGLLGVPALADPIVALVARTAYGSVLRRLLAGA